MKLKILFISLILSFLIISCMPPEVEVEAPAPQETETIEQPTPDIVKTETKTPEAVAPTFTRQEQYTASKKEYAQEGIIYEARNDRYKIRITGSVRTVSFTAPKFAFNVGDKVNFVETGTGEVKEVIKISSSVSEESPDKYQEYFIISEPAPNSRVYEREGSIIEAAPTRYVIRDSISYIKHTFFTDYNIDLSWGDKVSYRIDSQGNVISVRIISKYLPP